MLENASECIIIADEFNQKWNFSNCVGAFDTEHVALQAPFDSGTEYFNCKEFFSSVILAVVDKNFSFT